METTQNQGNGSPTVTDKPLFIPAWYAEMLDPYFHQEQCEARAALLAMMRPKK